MTPSLTQQLNKQLGIKPKRLEFGNATHIDLARRPHKTLRQFAQDRGLGIEFVDNEIHIIYMDWARIFYSPISAYEFIKSRGKQP